MAISTLILAVLVAAQPDAPSGFVGRWNVKLTDAENTFASGGLEITQEGGGLQAALVWRWGSFAPAKSAEVRDGLLRIVREDAPGKQDVFEARLVDGKLQGQVTYFDGKTHRFEAVRAPALTDSRAPAWGEPVALFDGTTLRGWRLRDPAARMGWAVVDGTLAVVESKGNADLVSESTFQDQKLHLEFAVDPKSNSGVYVRGRYEIQILDNPDAKMALDSHGCGAVYSRIAPRQDATRPAGEWNTLDVTMVGREVRVALNGIEIVNGKVDGITGGAIDPYEERPGPLMLQGDHGKVRFRNIVVTPAR